MKKNLILLILPLALFISCSPRSNHEITIPEIREEIAFLASDSLKGRYPGTPEEKVLSSYIAGEFRHAGLRLYEKDGLQPFRIIRHITAGEGNSLSAGDSIFSLNIDFAPMPFSSNGELKAGVVFAGYGFEFKNGSVSWNDYQDLEVKDKWVMILRGNPEPSDLSSVYISYSDDRSKALKAADHGAAGVIFISGPVNDPEGKLLPLKDKKPALSIPVIQLRRSLSDYLLEKAGKVSTAELEKETDSLKIPGGFELEGLILTGCTELLPDADDAYNTLAFLQGSDKLLRNQYVLIGAHHDHLGMGGPGSSSRRQDTVAVHYGADDNASGVAGVIELAGNLVTRKPMRSLIFSTFSGEEMGLLGSRYLVENPPVDIHSIVAMINLDMVGRLDEERTLQVNGAGTSPLFKALIDSVNRNYGFNIKISREGYGPSDHASFYAADIPVLFLTTGAHPDYHTPADSAGKINYEGCREVYEFASDLALLLANTPDSIPFTEAGPKVKASSAGRYGRITLGIMPDASYEGSDGLPVLFVTEGRPAAVGGIRKGDTIVAIEGKKVGNVYDYMERLGGLSEGQSLVVSVKREGSVMNLLVQL